MILDRGANLQAVVEIARALVTLELLLPLTGPQEKPRRRPRRNTTIAKAIQTPAIRSHLEAIEPTAIPIAGTRDLQEGTRMRATPTPHTRSSRGSTPQMRTATTSQRGRHEGTPRKSGTEVTAVAAAAVRATTDPPSTNSPSPSTAFPMQVIDGLLPPTLMLRPSGANMSRQ